MIFLADCMLGKLTRWLRFSGNHALYSPHLADDDLLEFITHILKDSPVLLLTRDKQLAIRATKKNYACVLIRPTKVLLQLNQLLTSAFQASIRIDPFSARCAVCSGQLTQHELSKRSSMSRLEELAAKGYLYYFECSNPSCEKIYWRGLAWKDAFSRLCEILNYKRLRHLARCCQTQEDLKTAQWATQCIERNLQRCLTSEKSPLQGHNASARRSSQNQRVGHHGINPNKALRPEANSEFSPKP